MRRSIYQSLKRVLDLIVASTAMVLTAPLQVVVSVLIRSDLGSPVLFRQPRPGKDGVIFEMVKFRTMRDPDPARGLVSDEQRLTTLGSFLRSTSIDELPTLWNVITGDMSLVGPRPLLVHYLERYSPHQLRRHEVRPGVTGLAQVNGRNSLPWSDKLALDVEYVERCSLALDVRLLLRTLACVARRTGISGSHGPTMSEFEG